MKGSYYIAVFITTSTAEEAERIANALLSQKKAACVNIIPGVQSHFLWQGKIDSASESLLVVKTEERLLDEVIRLVRELHSYSIPEVIALPIVGGNKDYLDWLSECVRE